MNPDLTNPMIRRITTDTFDDIVELLLDLIEKRRYTDSPIEDSFVDEARGLLSEGRIQMLAEFRSSRLLGFVMIDRESSRIGPFHSYESTGSAARTKKRLFDEAFHEMSETEHLIRTGGPSIDPALSDYILKRGFKRFDRKNMKITRAAIGSLCEPALPSDFAFSSYRSDMNAALARLIHTANAGHSEADLYPEFFASEEGAVHLLDVLQELKTHPDYSKVLRRGNNLVGACLIVTNTDHDGHVAEMCIDKGYRRRGLARNLLTHSLTELLRSIHDLEYVTLDVTLDNPARLLYESLGFESLSEYATFTWTKAQRQEARAKH